MGEGNTDAVDLLRGLLRKVRPTFAPAGVIGTGATSTRNSCSTPGVDDGLCDRCGLRHAAGQLFVATRIDYKPFFEDTCELKSAWSAAHAAPMQAGARAYHATDSLASVLAHGSIRPARKTKSLCKHVCLASTPEIAAGTMEKRRRAQRIPLDVEYPVLEVDVAGLDLFFELGEARHHGSVIGPERLHLLEPQPAPLLGRVERSVLARAAR